MTTPNDASTPQSLDQLYEPFPAFSEWANCNFEVDAWNSKKSHRDSFIGDAESMSLSETTREVTRMAAYDTGALENLYETDRGITRSFAQFSGILSESFPDSEQQKVFHLVESQLAAYELTIDAVANKTPISSAWIREIHKQICASQDTYEVTTPIGKRTQSLPKGEFKKYANHVQLQDGGVFAYAPVKDTEHEVRRLLTEMNSVEFQNAHCVLQAAYAHYAFVRIHPFADGNGRVSRVLASLYLYREASIPLLIFADQRDDYLYALRQADENDHQSFVDFIFERAIDTLDIQSHYIQAKSIPTLSHSMSDIRETIQTKKYSPSELDRLASKLLTDAKESLESQIQNENWIKGVSAECQIMITSKNAKYRLGGYRSAYAPNDKQKTPNLFLTIRSQLGDGTKARKSVPIFIEVNKAQNPKIVVGQNELMLEVNADEVGQTSQSYKMKLALWTDRLLRTQMQAFRQQFSQKYKSK